MNERVQVTEVNRERTRRTVWGRGVAALALLGGLGATSACGSQLDPGVAVQVGSQTYSMGDLDSDTAALCSALQADSRMIGTGYAMSSLRNSVAQSLAFIALADELGRQHGVSASADFRKVQQQSTVQLASADDDVREQVLPIFTAQQYFVDVARQVGAQQASASGGDASDDDATLQAGLQIASDEAEKLGITMSPQLSQITLTPQKLDSVSQQTSVAVSDFATQAAADQPDDAYLAGLPAAQKCMPKA